MNGWEIKSSCDGSYPPLSQYQPRRNDDGENETLVGRYRSTDCLYLEITPKDLERVSPTFKDMTTVTRYLQFVQ